MIPSILSTDGSRFVKTRRPPTSLKFLNDLDEERHPDRIHHPGEGHIDDHMVHATGKVALEFICDGGATDVVHVS